ncbi:hypothetical protein KP509_05G039900 [Ceratopteris richardii]|uniref:Tetratricopeptide repeat protein 29 n=1 Tax=Ceratopteris richardii TaxID=49495 RepID=A0A8T2USK7_CERRI|nr:hypothetical protein KP509_05G039900 [Ceratopteris richardii]
MMVETTTQSASLESSNLDSAHDNTSASSNLDSAHDNAISTLINASATLSSKSSQQDSKSQEIKEPKVQWQRYTHAEMSTKLKADLMAKLELEVERNASGLTFPSISMQQNLCMKMLSDGKPNSFIEFFNLTHSEAHEDPLEGPETKKQKDLSPDHLSSLSENLVKEEIATRIGDFENLSKINFEIAGIFENCGQHNKAVFYLLRSLEYSKQGKDPLHQAKVKFSLGNINKKMGSLSDAISWFEDYLVSVRDSNDEEGLVMGSRELLEVYGLCANKARKKLQLHKALDLFEKSVNMADICGDSRAKAEAKHQLGLIHQELGEFHLALQYQLEFLDFCCSEDDMMGQSKAHAAIAETQESMGETEKAIQHLEASLDVSQHVNLETQAAACCKLGIMYNKQYIYDKALIYFEKFFELACALKEPKLMDAARLNIGYVKSILNTNESVFSTPEI